MKRIYIIDWILIPLFILTSYTGIGLHIAAHENDHEIWHNWAVFHVIASLLFLITVIFHIITHWNWYKGIVNKGIGQKSRVTLWLSATFTLVVLTGIILFNVDGANSSIGLCHYNIGFLMNVLSIGHIFKRIPILRKCLKKK